MRRIEQQLPEYLASLEDFIAQHDLPPEWFEAPDHIAYKCVDTVDFDKVMTELEPSMQQLSCIYLDNRRLGAGHMNLHLDIGDFGSIEWLEIMEPRPDLVGTDVVGLEHMEFYFPDFLAVKRLLDDESVPYEMQENPNHSWINIVINDKGQELKLNNGTLAHIVEDELEQGLAILYTSHTS